MPGSSSRPPQVGLTPSQRRILLWMPLLAIEAVMYLVSKPVDGPRNWGDMIVVWVFAGALYLGVWWAMSLATRPAGPPPTTEEKVAERGSRAAVIYGKGEAPEDEEGDT